MPDKSDIALENKNPKRTSCPATVTSTLGDPSMVRERWERGREGRSRCTWVAINVIGESVLHPKIVEPFVVVKVW